MFGLFKNQSETAQATVLNSQLLHNTGSDEHQGGIYEFTLEVQPPNGVPFRAIVKYHGSSMIRQPQAGAVLTVSYHPKKRDIKLDLKGDPRYDLSILSNALAQEQQQKKARLLSGAPGTPVPAEENASAQIIHQMMQDDPSKKQE